MNNTVPVTSFIKGRIEFEASKGFRDLFLENCRNNGILLNNVCALGADIVTAEISYHDMNKLFIAAEKSGMEIDITHRYGLPDLYFRYRKRIGIPIGLLLAAIILVILKSMLWSIDISGNEFITNEMIIEMLEEAGVRKGVFCATVNCDDLEYFMYNKTEGLSWVSVYIAGSRMFVEIRERMPESENDDKTFYCNLIAAKDGEIIRADIFTGDGKLYPGTAVVKGDLLVSGVVTMRDGSVKFVNSDAVITARTKNNIVSAAPYEISISKLDVCKDKYLLYFFGMELPLGAGVKTDDFTETQYYFSSGDMLFPIGIIRENYKMLYETRVELTESEALLLAFYDFARTSLPLYENTVVKDRKITLNFNSEVRIEGLYFCEENIAEKKEFTVEDISSKNR